MSLFLGLLYRGCVLSYLLVTSAFTTWHTSSIQTMIGEAILVAILRFEVLQEVEVVGLVTGKRKRKLKFFFVFLCFWRFLNHLTHQFDMFMHVLISNPLEWLSFWEFSWWIQIILKNSFSLFLRLLAHGKLVILVPASWNFLLPLMVLQCMNNTFTAWLSKDFLT